MKRIITFYLIALGFTSVVALLIANQILPTYFHYVAVFGPMIAAFVMFSKNKQLKTKIKELTQVNKPLWVLLGGTSPLWGSLLVILTMKLLNYSLPNLISLGEVNFLGNISFWALPLWILTTGIGEEFGWRGYLYPELRTKYSNMTTTFIMWPMWVVWHLPFFLYTPNYANMNIGLFIGFIFSLLSGVIVLNWVFEKSGRNVLATMLWHGTFNLVTASAFGSGNVAMILSLVVVLFSFVILASRAFPKTPILEKVA